MNDGSEIDLMPFAARKLNLNAHVIIREDEEAQADAFDEMVRATSRPGDDNVPDDNGTVPAWAREMDAMESTIADFEAAAARQAQTHDELVAALNELRDIVSTRQERLLHDEEMLSIQEACCLPELGGRLYDDGMAVPGRHIKAKTLYEEIKSGRLKLAAGSKSGKFLVSRRTIREWIETEWHAEDSPLTSYSSATRSTKPPASSARGGIGRSPTDRSGLARDSALSIVQKLRRPDSTTK